MRPADLVTWGLLMLCLMNAPVKVDAQSWVCLLGVLLIAAGFAWMLERRHSQRGE